jgi:O-antigen ligase
MKDNSAASRMVIVKAQVQMLEQSPLIGHGHRGTLILSPFFVEKRYQTITEGGASLRASHNVVMAFLVDHGIFGALLYFAAITRCGWRIFAYRQLPIDETDLPRQEKHRELSNLLVGAVLGLFCFMIGGLGSNNKKLEADIWLLALIPVIHRQIKENNQGGSLDVIKQHTKKNKPPLVGLLSAEAPKSSLSGILR